jgi:hypothetical protein
MLLLNHDLAKNKNMPKRKSGATRRRPAKKQSILTRKSKFYLPWPFVSLILMSVGVLLIGWTFQAGAADVHVTAKVSAALPTGPATILSPTDGDRFKDVPITVSGTCPTDTYVNIYRNNFFSGTAMCTTDGNFSIKSDFAYRGYRVGQNVEMVFEASGGEPPYALNVEWGDGTNTVVSQEEAGKITVNHQYKKAGNRTNSSFVIKISGSDSKGRYSYLQLFLIVHPSGVTGFVANTLPPGPHIKSSWLKFIWPAYGVVILMAVSFWLGEREELIDLKRSRLRHRHT